MDWNDEDEWEWTEEDEGWQWARMVWVEDLLIPV